MKQGFVICTHRKTRLFFRDCINSFVVPNIQGPQVYEQYPVIVVLTGDDGHYYEGFHSIVSGVVDRVVRTPECWEVNALRAAVEQTDLDEMFFLQDTFELVNPQALADVAFVQYKGYACPVNNHFQCYAGKYRRSGLTRVNWPEVKTKADAVRNESDFNRHYLDREPAPRQNLFPEFRDSRHIVQKHGRANTVIENAYLRKWKGTWQANLQDRLHDIDQRGAV